MENNTEPRFYTIEMLAERWRVSPRTVRRLIENGPLRAVRVGKQLRVAADVLRRYEERQQTMPRADRYVR
jgi:excisionase family DNA binding protein